MLYRINILLSCLLVLVIAMLAFSRVDHSRPNYQVTLGDDMTYGPAYTSFSTNPNFPNGRTLQPPVPGTIARGAQVFHYASSPQDALRAGIELTNPIDLSTDAGVASTERGVAAYNTFCISCHAADGNGNGPVAQRGFPPPPSLLTGKSREMRDGQLFHILTYGQNSMPEFAAQLSPERRWDVINHIRKLQQAAPPLLDAAADSTAIDPTAQTTIKETTTSVDTEAEQSPESSAVEEQPRENPANEPAAEDDALEDSTTEADEDVQP